MFSRLKAFRALAEEIREKEKQIDSTDGRRTVRVRIAEENEFLSPLSPDGAPVISEETASFLAHSVRHLRPDTALRFEIEEEGIDRTEREVYEKAIRNYYHGEFAEVVRDLRRNAIVAAVMTVTAALIFALAVIFDRMGADTVLLNMIDVVAWVFMWEAADIFFLQRPALKLRRWRSFQMIRAEIAVTEPPLAAAQTPGKPGMSDADTVSLSRTGNP